MFDAFGPEPDDAAVRPRHPAPAGAHARRRPPPLGWPTPAVHPPGTPVLRYGEEIGMGDDLSLPERDAIRTPMQWYRTNAGFSTCKQAARSPTRHRRPRWLRDLKRGHRTADELVARLVEAHAAHPARVSGVWRRVVAGARRGDPAVLGMLYSQPTGQVLAVSNLSPRKRELDLTSELPDKVALIEMFSDRHLDDDPAPGPLRLAGYGYRWFRLLEQ